MLCDHLLQENARPSDTIWKFVRMILNCASSDICISLLRYCRNFQTTNAIRRIRNNFWSAEILTVGSMNNIHHYYWGHYSTQLEVWTPVLRGRYNIPCGELFCVTTKYQAIASFNSGFDLQSWPALLSSAFSRRKQHLSLFYDNLAERWNRPERLELKSKFGYYRYNYFKTSARVEQHTDYGSQS